MKAFADMTYHPASEELVGILRDRAQKEDSLFFRIMVAYYFSLAAAQMRCKIITPDKGEVPVNMYALNLAPSGYGKTLSSNLMEHEVLHLFRDRFVNETFQAMAQDNLPKLALKRANRKGTEPDEELVRVKKDFDSLGDLLFSFDSGTGPAVKQMRHKLLMANAGSMNLIMDEVGNNLTANQEVFDTFIELYDKGLTKQKLIKSTAENARMEEILGQTPSNLLMFGVPSRLLDGDKTEADLMKMLDTGYARRCFFGYVKSVTQRQGRTAEGMYLQQTSQASNTDLEALAMRLEDLANMINANKHLVIKPETSIYLNEYQLACEARAEQLPPHQEMQKSEIANRHFKVLKLAGAYAFIDDATEVTITHIEHAIKLAEESGAAFTAILSRDKPWVKLAKYVANVGKEVNQADLAEDLPFYKGSNSAKSDMMMLATAWGYRNNIIIKKSFSDGIEFLRGETLKETDLSKMVVAYSTDMTTGYMNETPAFDQLHRLTQAPGMHWVAHHLMKDESGFGYRNEENAIAGFNLVVIDVDGGVDIGVAKTLMAKHKFLLYTTKRHQLDGNGDRFRMIFPTNFELKMDAKDYKEFMAAVYEWLPFDCDTATNQRARKWMSHDGHYEYNEGELLDVLPFIPKTSKDEQRKLLLDNQASMDKLERWVMNNIGDGNRNNMLLRYAMLLVDAGFDIEKIRTKVLSLNDKIADKLDEAEIMTTIMVSVMKQITKRP